MPGRLFFPFYPRKILWTGLLVLGSALAVGMLFIWGNFRQRTLGLKPVRKEHLPLFEQKDLRIALGPPDAFRLRDTPRIEGEIAFSLVHLRPGTQSGSPYLQMQCKRSGQSKKISLPSRVSLCYLSGDLLGFSEEKSPFWAEFSDASSGKIQVVVCVDSVSEGTLETERFTLNPQAVCVRAASEFAEGSPFRSLAESKWLGQDLFFEKYGGMVPLYRIGAEEAPKERVVAIGKSEWLFWKEGRWNKGPLSEDPKIPVARLASADFKSLIFECWDLEHYVRLSVPLVSSPALKIRGDELFHSVRIRSERQISCMLEKQCLILRCGDWVLKTDGRWKILKKAEEKEAYRKGVLTGELFVFDKIDSKQGQKWIQGTFFNGDKTQMAAIDMQVNPQTVRRRAHP